MHNPTSPPKSHLGLCTNRNPIIARSKRGAIHNSTHFSGPDGLGQPVAQLEVVMFRWDVMGTVTRVEVG